MSSRSIAFKFKVKQEYEVVIYYENGITADNLDDADDAIIDDVLNCAFNEEGLVVKTDEDSENSNAFIAMVTTFEPDVEQVYSMKELPAVIKKELIAKKLV